MARPKLASRVEQTDWAHNPSSVLDGVVVALSDTGCEVRIAGLLRHAQVATHVPGVQTGQRVLLQEVNGDCLVTAAWPLPGNEAPFVFDAPSGLLRIQASRLQLAAVGSIELRCGDASVRLTLDGKVQIEGKDLLSAAVGANRIEGASIDLN
jgi:hypothetical protein